MPTNRKGVRVTVYLPDELRERARAEDLNLSRILRDGVERELRGESGPTVELNRAGDALELRVRIPLNLLRRLVR